MTVCDKLAKAMAKLKNPRDDDKVEEGERRINAMRLKLQTYRVENKRTHRASDVDQEVAAQNAMIQEEDVVEAEYDKIVSGFIKNSHKRRLLQGKKTNGSTKFPELPTKPS